MIQQDRQFMTQFAIVLGALVVFTIAMFFLARYLMTVNQVDYGPLIASEIQHRIEPEGVSKMENVVEVATAAPEGKSTFEAMCSTCHVSGALGAPIITDKAAWQSRLTQGPKALYSSAINGIGTMPAKGGHSQLSDDQVKAAVNYIMSQVSGSKTAQGAQPKPQTGSGIVQAVAQGASPEGKSTFEAVCSTCHSSGALGAPMITDKAAWKSRIAQGPKVLYSSALNGIGNMPAKGGHPELSDDQVKLAVDYIVSQVSKTDQSTVTAGETANAAVDAVVGAVTLGTAGKATKSPMAQAAAQGASPASKSTYQTMCSTCHSSGALGAPMITDKGAWSARIAQGPKVLYSSALNGIGAMPGKGGHSQLSDSQVKAAVDYIISQVSGSKAAQGAQPKPQTGASTKQAAVQGASPEGKSTFEAMCSTCHVSGALGAPMVTDKAAWQARVAQGTQVLYSSAINGIGAMPAKGGHPQLSDDQVKAAVDYIVSQVSGGGGGQQQKGKASAMSQGASAAAAEKKASAPPAKTQAGADGKQAAAQGASLEGKSTYQAMCSTCHDSGALGAPKFGDKAAWKARIAQGNQVLYSSAINGIGAMPAKGGHAQLSEQQVKAAVDYMTHAVK